MAECFGLQWVVCCCLLSWVRLSAMACRWLGALQLEEMAAVCNELDGAELNLVGC
jgi:hypothetical protein